ncbi:MAG: hypothetical protein ABI321_01985 [Polyangia bacterium]
MWRSFTSPAGTHVYFRVEGACLENIIVGNHDAACARALQREYDIVEARHQQFVGFHYWMHAPTYDTESRVLWMNWLRTKNGTLKETHFAARSRIVKMGLAVANLAYSNTTFVVHGDDASYLAARKKHMSDLAFPELPPA